MSFPHEHFTMSYAQSQDYGIKYRAFEKVDRLPSGRPLIAIAGLWGSYQNIRCLFADEEGNGFLRNIKGGGGKYIIGELGVNAKEIKVGEWFEVDSE